MKQTVKLHTYLAAQFDACGKTQREIAQELGYKNPNIITMFKQARTKVPLNKIALMAKVVGVDPVNLLKIAMLDYMPETWETIESIIGSSTTENEFEILDYFRSKLEEPGSDPKLKLPRQRKALDAFAHEMST